MSNKRAPQFHTLPWDKNNVRSNTENAIFCVKINARLRIYNAKFFHGLIFLAYSIFQCCFTITIIRISENKKVIKILRVLFPTKLKNDVLKSKKKKEEKFVNILSSSLHLYVPIMKKILIS